MKRHSNLKSIFVATIAGIVFALSAAAAQSDILLDNYGSLTGTSYNYIQGYNSEGYWQNAASGGVSFTPTLDYYLNTISVLAKYFGGSSSSFELSIYSNINYTNADGTQTPLPWSRLVSKSINIKTDSTNTYDEYTANFGSNVRLKTGTTYWAVVEATDPDSDIYFGALKGAVPALDSSRRAMFGNMLKRLNADGSVNTSNGAPDWMHMYNISLKVTGTQAVPEPSGLLAVLSGVISIAPYAKRKKRARYL